MINALLSVNADLGSSIALRYARELSNKMDVQLHGIHVIDPNRFSNAPDSGWVRRTWENTLVETEKEEIRRFLFVEKADQPFIKIPKVIIGERSDRLLNELSQNKYALYMEGVPPTTNPNDFHKLIHSHLYRMLPCPVLVVKNLLEPIKAAVFLNDHPDLSAFAASVSTIFKNSAVTVDPIYFRLDESTFTTIKESDNLNKVVENFKPDDSVALGKLKIIEGSPRAAAEWLREYGMVISSLKRAPGKNDQMMGILSLASSPVLIFWR